MRLRLRRSLVLLVLVAMAVGCGSDEKTTPNLPPSITWVEFPPITVPVASSARFEWTGTDPDGSIARYETSLDSETTFTSTTETATTLTFTRADGTPENPVIHVFRVRAVDDLGLVGSAAERAFTVSVPDSGAPVVIWLERPAEGATVTDSTLFRWSGTGPIDGYETSLDSETNYTATADSSARLRFTRADGTSTIPGAHIFRVRAVDDAGSRGVPLAASFFVAIPNAPPTVAFTTTPPESVYAGPVVRLAWLGDDADGTVAGYEYVLDDTLGTWIPEADTSVVLDFDAPSARPGPEHAGNVTRPVTFFLRAIDNDGGTSPIISASFITGPPNQRPTIALVTVPSETITGEGTWGWTSLDPDGDVVSVQWAVDLASEADWSTLVGRDDVTISFTRADGTAEAPVSHVFSVRSVDDDGDPSDVATHTFSVGVPNQAPTVSFVNPPPAGSPVLYRQQINWMGTDEDGIDFFELAIDDTSAWMSFVGTEDRATFLFDSPDAGSFEPPANPAAPVDSSFGSHVIYLRATDVAGAVSPVVTTAFTTFTFTPFTTLLTPNTTDGEVTLAVGDTLRFGGLDVDRIPGPGSDRSPRGYEVKWVDVADLGALPEAQTAVPAAPGAWTVLADGETSFALDVPGPGAYLLAVRARDEVAAMEPYFEYGRNTLKITVP